MGCGIKYSDMRIANTPEDKITEIEVKGENGFCNKDKISSIWIIPTTIKINDKFTCII
eukprot:SAG22_NODE_3728_length_1557_cov_1.725652_3_plen_57_part_01